MTDTVIVEAGRVIEVHRGSRNVRPPFGRTAIHAAGGLVHPGMIWDEAGRVFRSEPTPLLDIPRTFIGAQINSAPAIGIPVVAGLPVETPAAVVPAASSNVNTINITVNAPPPASVPPAPFEIVQAAPPAVLHDAPRPSGAVDGRDGTGIDDPRRQGSSLPPGSAAAVSLDVVAAIRALQVEVWPPERERFADLAALFLTYGDASAVPDLAAIVPANMTIREVAEIALAARADAQSRIASLSSLIERSRMGDEPSSILAAAQRIADGGDA